MPCHDPRDEMDRQRVEKDRDALVALMCAIHEGTAAGPGNVTPRQTKAAEIAYHWWKAHQRMEAVGMEHRNKYGTAEYEEIKRFQGMCDAALDRAYLELVQ